MSTKTIFLVSLHTGVYEDKHTEVLRAFGDRSDAEQFALEKTKDVSAQVACYRAVGRMMKDWEERNPEPTLEVESEEYNKRWQEEHDRVYALIYGKTSEPSPFADDYFHIGIQEIPMT